MDNRNNPKRTPSNQRLTKDKQILVESIRKQIETKSGLTIDFWRKNADQLTVFYIGAKYVTTTKKVLTEALQLPIEHCCRYKRELEKNGFLVQSIKPVICPFTKYRAHLISTNPNEFERLTKINNNQLTLFAV
ncbi:MAG: hypothetical protein ACXITV_04895 [Luteibaculaceae bacterium]